MDKQGTKCCRTRWEGQSYTSGVSPVGVSANDPENQPRGLHLWGGGAHTRRGGGGAGEGGGAGAAIGAAVRAAVGASGGVGAGAGGVPGRVVAEAAGQGTGTRTAQNALGGDNNGVDRDGTP